MTALNWLPPPPADWRARLRDLPNAADPWAAAQALAQYRLDFSATNALDTMLGRALAGRPPKLTTRPVRLAILSSCTTAHLHAGLRVALLRRGITAEIFETDFGQYWQALSDRSSALHDFRPDSVLFALDARHLTAGIHAALDDAQADAAFDSLTGRLSQLWSQAREAFGATVLMQTALPTLPRLMGGAEHRLRGSPAAVLARLNAWMRDLPDGPELIALDTEVAMDGLAAWHDPLLWDRAKQDISPVAAPMYGELVGRILAARQGLSRKCLVLDLDNTLWGGVIGDDGMEGIVLGQGDAQGEGYANLQNYAKDLARRGIILAVCSKNDEANAREPFESHPEMVLRLSDIAAFRANWDDKPQNLRIIAEMLNIGIDSLVFLDDNPFERNLVREALPMVGVPEWDAEPAHAPALLARAGYFESLGITDEDRARTAQYQENAARDSFKAEAADLVSYLRGLAMRMPTAPFDRVGLPRIVQLINKSNQFNLTTKRYTEEEVEAVMGDPTAFGLQLRLLDRFGDNGVIAIIIGRSTDRLGRPGDLDIDTWLMSCRVLGRGVEAATLNVIAAQARALGAQRLIGTYIPTKKNGMVRDHYARLGFTLLDTQPDGSTTHALELASFVSAETWIEVETT